MTIPESTRDYLVVRRDPSLPEWWPWPASQIWWCDEHGSTAFFESVILLGGSNTPNDQTICYDIKLFGTGHPDELPCRITHKWLAAVDYTDTNELPRQVNLLLDLSEPSTPQHGGRSDQTTKEE